MTRADQHPMWTLVWILMRIQLWIHLSGPRGDERRRRATATTTVRIPARIEAGTDDTTARRPALVVRAGGWDRGGDG